MTDHSVCELAVRSFKCGTIVALKMYFIAKWLLGQQSQMVPDCQEACQPFDFNSVQKGGGGNLMEILRGMWSMRSMHGMQSLRSKRGLRGTTSVTILLTFCLVTVGVPRLVAASALDERNLEHCCQEQRTTTSIQRKTCNGQQSTA